MACATISLKRSLDFDPLSPRRPKRRRCTPMTITPTPTSPPKPPSVFKEATTSMSKGQNINYHFTVSTIIIVYDSVID